MAVEYREKDDNKEEHIQDKMITSHSFSDLSHVPAATFIFLLKECYLSGTKTATSKFRVLQQHVLQALYNSPQPCPSLFIIQCLYVLPLLGPQYTEGFSHLLISAFRRLKSVDSVFSGFYEAKIVVAKFCLDILSGIIHHEERILIKLLEVFEIDLNAIGKAICGSEFNDDGHDMAKAYIMGHIIAFIESHSYATAVKLLEHFSILMSDESFLERMLHANQFEAAERWTSFMGKSMIRTLVQKYYERNMLKKAHDIIVKHGLTKEFQDVERLYKESLLKKLAEKGCWDIAEHRAKKDRYLIEYLVYLAMEAGYTEMVGKLCKSYSLEGFDISIVPDKISSETCFLDLKKFEMDEVKWVDEIGDLLDATNYLEECKIVGIDCEWKPNYVKGSLPNKVSIIQIASEKRAFIFDLIKLYKTEPKMLDCCFKRILASPEILKLGYNFRCDMNQLSQSYGDLECFQHYKMLLDIQNLFKEPNGGLSKLAEKTLGAGLNKTRRNSNWEERPLSQNQIEYAALDAVVLLHIFNHVRGHAGSAGSKDELPKMEWKSHIVPCFGRLLSQNSAIYDESESPDDIINSS